MTDLYTMIATVQAYINHRKGIEININMDQFHNPANVIKLQSAYSIATQWFKDNN